MHGCDATCPDLMVICDSRTHSGGVAHHASGTAGDGTRWSVFWWRPGEVVEPPVPPAAGLDGRGAPDWAPGRPPA